MTVGIVEEKSITFQTDLRLESGRILGPITIAYETYGILNADRSNAIMVTHAWTGSAHLAGRYCESEQKPGWWNEIVGPGKLLDTNRYFVICSNVIGSCFGSTGPASINPKTGKKYALTFPVITVRDMVRAQALLIDHLGIERLHAVMGGSMGGMQALEWATQFPDRIASAVILATTPRPSAQAISLNAVARWAIFNDPTWKKGEYRKNPRDGLALARGIGHITFLSDESMTAKFGRRFSAKDGQFDFFGQFEVERYLNYNGYNFVDRFDTNAFLYLAKALDLYDVAWGYESLEEAFAQVKAPMQFFAFSSDWLYPPPQTEEMVRMLKKLGKPVEYHLINSAYGHDAFLLEHETFTPMVRDFLKKAGA
ncbi:homoserine O-acetyltransferase [Geotalea daltonii FRC-32]|uniref:Homoserine O-acetyltransferase n=1 Tax=Geotalea daltonii (strain DSM 22248 / JCM 15807 / FRC-32) TaxID=316067 RepID=METXA_GEODF|nr:homoserine O-acetyltransferase [Geotalea daltonii]B9M4M5.1 RecName: Full=Homoserine O-acetyltransferase; Short=HAT; AltName: Full=Homoserine transacetylase; Short=HTA [Geotalea daltonii FRC-32]ACM19751.1 homoserine O-acetyltransferase [Geotalea daltonii FRC-32]